MFMHFYVKNAKMELLNLLSYDGFNVLGFGSSGITEIYLMVSSSELVAVIPDVFMENLDSWPLFTVGSTMQ